MSSENILVAAKQLEQAARILRNAAKRQEIFDRHPQMKSDTDKEISNVRSILVAVMARTGGIS